MPISSGPNTSAESNIVFSYDTGDTRNSYRGEPTSNYYGDIDSSIALRTVAAEYNTSNWKAGFPKPPLDIGRVYKHTSGTLNSTWSGNSYGYTLKNYTYPANAIYTLSAWVYVSPDCNISQLNISIEGGGSWIDYNYQYDLGNKGTWQRIWLRVNTLGGFSGNAIPIYPQRWGVTDGSFTGFYAWGGAMLEAKDHITQYTLTSRSATQSLLPLIGNTSIDLSNVSFNSNAQITFDGSNDYINTNVTLGTNGTIELIIKSSNYGSKIPISINSDTYSSGPNIYFDSGLICWNTGDSATNAFTNSSYPNSNYHHLVITNIYSGLATLYIDGVLIGTANGLNMTTTSTNKLWIGRYHDGSYNFNGDIPIVKIYNKVLSIYEIKQNYQQYKSRFNLS